MPVTILPHPDIKVEPVDGNPRSSAYQFASSSTDLLNGIWPDGASKLQIWSSSFPDSHFSDTPSRDDSSDPVTRIVPATNGLVRAVYRAYSSHHALVLRPEDVWLAILSQFSFYVQAHDAALRSKFVAHEGKKELELISDAGTRFEADFGWFAEEMTRLIQESVVDPELREWMLPGFSTTTETDRVVGAVLMMGTLKNYFAYKFTLRCGIPSVTLLGEKADYEEIARRIEKLKTFGEEPTRFAELLRPVVRRMVRSFEDPTGSGTLDFWRRIAHVQPGGSGPTYYSGWITAFCFWDKDGKVLQEKAVAKGKTKGLLHLDEAYYQKVDSQDVPPGWGQVNVTVQDRGKRFKTVMIAGSVGISAIPEEGLLDEDYQPAATTLQPEVGWWMCERTGDEDDEEEENITGYASRNVSLQRPGA